ncbi:HAD-IA family hydrolase [Pseudomonas gingeri]|uniref:HAD-IA family hydrolase n=1 Tax=Pseudomonas gingeri TaxID=117681 RepID=A0A7Y8CJR6_9PSED|nr:HAD-IA family hydrolase [Pseudomonas gingeri]NWB25623.1 HAD-IA family hydrolase [Pseudomonas gingeri]NWC33337.1 HAD-IA family hydrolase [Pseudomonas gingeri]NWD06513.1 HAD-IA family hydrolase [Pseudomonas gingeri]NWE33207.1 HAD-IA family hydrolase [Pseudomonas gingeri]NWE55456.1 HAD-IA family hydrolase [Pseudomonas gingeri]
MFEGQRFAAFLFDMDGTLLNSIAAAERVWSHWARRHGLDVEAFLKTIHGVRSIDTVRRQNLPGVDAECEAAAISQAEIDDVEGVVAIDGALAFLNALPPQRWAVVTSAPRALAESRMAAAGIALPDLVISAEDVTRGKPAPDGYLLAAQRLGVAPAQCLIFEDAPAGIGAAEAAGIPVVVISATHGHPLQTPHPTLEDYRRVTVDSNDQGLALRQA